MKPSGTPLAVRLWTARSESNDFRESKWTSEDVSGSAGQYEAAAAKTGSERVAVFGEAQYEYEGLKYSLSTLVFWK